MQRILPLLLLILVACGPASKTKQSATYNKAYDLALQGEYEKALTLYTKDNAENPNPKTEEGLAHCYRMMDKYEEAEMWYSKAIQQPTPDAPLLIGYAEVLMRAQKYDKAKEILKKVDAKNMRATLMAVSCDSAMHWAKRSTAFKADNAPYNTCYADYAPFMLSKYLVFSSNRPELSPACSKPVVNPYLLPDKAYFSTPSRLQDEDRDSLLWQSVAGYPYPFNASKYKVAGPIYVSRADTSMRYFTLASKKRNSSASLTGQDNIFRRYTGNLEIHCLKTEPGKSAPKSIAFEYNKSGEYSVGYPCLSADGKILYFASDMPGGLGGFDIWYCEKQGNGKWGKPINAGYIINTAADESFPSISPSGAFYFASNGLPGFGGFDVFRTSGSKNKWSKPQNLMAQINSSADDFYPTVMQGDDAGVFASNRSGGKGGHDIYAFVPYKETSPVYKMDLKDRADDFDFGLCAPKANPNNVLLQGVVIDRATQRPIAGAKVCASNPNNQSTVCFASMVTGRFCLELEQNTKYNISAFRAGYAATTPLLLIGVIEGEDLTLEMETRVAGTRDELNFVSTKDIVDKQRTIQEPKKVPVREYKIQLLALRKDLDWSYFDIVREAYPHFEVEYTVRSQMTRYTYGSFPTLEEAKRKLDSYYELGYTDSFIVRFDNGIPVENIYKSGRTLRLK